MAQGLATFDLQAILERKTRLVRAVMDYDPTVAANWNPNALMSVSAHVAARYSARQDLMEDRARAQGIILCLLNYALETLVAAKRQRGSKETEIEIAHALAGKAGIERLIAYAEKRQDELHARFIKLNRENVIYAKFREMPARHYGITDPVTETQLYHYAHSMLLDQYDLPIATLEEEASLVAICNRVEQEIEIANYFNWENILNEFGNVTKFASRYFMRARKNQPNPAGGVLRPFLMGMVVKAFGGKWGVSQHDKHTQVLQAVFYSFPEISELEGFLERVVEQRVPNVSWMRHRHRDGDASELDMKYRHVPLEPVTETDVAVKIGQMLYRPVETMQNVRMLRLKKISKEKALLVCKFAADAFTRAMEDAKRFYHFERGEKMPSGVEIQEFWCDRIFMSMSLNDRIALGETWAKRNEPWRTDLSRVTTMEELLRLAEGFTMWPESDRSRLASDVPINRIVRGSADLYTQANSLLEVWGFMSRAEGSLPHIIALMDRVQWDSRRRWFRELCGMTTFHREFLPVLLHIARKMTWSNRLLLQMVETPIAEEMIKIAVPKIGDDLTFASWKNLIHRTREYQCSTALWETMKPEHLLTCFDEFSPDSIRALAMKGSDLRQVVHVFGPLLHAMRGNDVARERFRVWAKSRPGRRGLNLPPQYRPILEMLWAETFEDRSLELDRVL